MVIDASRVFGCNHSYLAVTDNGVLLFACLTCGHKAYLLPLNLATSGPRVVPFEAFRPN